MSRWWWEEGGPHWIDECRPSDSPGRWRKRCKSPDRWSARRRTAGVGPSGRRPRRRDASSRPPTIPPGKDEGWLKNRRTHNQWFCIATVYVFIVNWGLEKSQLVLNLEYHYLSLFLTTLLKVIIVDRLLTHIILYLKSGSLSFYI